MVELIGELLFVVLAMAVPFLGIKRLETMLVGSELKGWGSVFVGLLSAVVSVLGMAGVLVILS